MFRRSAILVFIAAALFSLAAQGCSSESLVAPVAAETSFARAASSSMTVDIAVAPSTIIIKDEGEWVTVHAVIAYSSVDAETVLLDGITAVSTFADARGELVAKFDHAEICAIVAPPQATLTLTGLTTGGEPFEGIDTVRVSEKGNS